jgi:hypothetical protein
VPQVLADYFTLYSIYRGTSKSVVIEEQLTRAMSKEATVEQIIDRLATRAISEWNTRMRGNIGKKGWQTTADEKHRCEEYCLELERTLIARGVGKKHIERILQPLKGR